MEPDSTSVTVGDSVRLEATVLGPSDASLNEDVTWTSLAEDVAAVNGDGMVTGTSAGTAHIEAESGGVRDTAAVTVLADTAATDSAPDDSTSTGTTAPRRPETISVAEAARTDSTVRYTAAWSSSDGAERYSWSAGASDETWNAAGTVSDTVASFTAPRGSSPDSAHACVVAKNGGGSSTSRCTDFSVPESAADSTGGSDGGASPVVDECASPESAWIWCDDFQRDRLSSYFEYGDAGGSFVPGQDVGVGGSRGMRVRFSEGQVGAGFLHLAFGDTPDAYFTPVDSGTRDYREIYWRLYVRYQEGWVGGGGSKLSRATSFAASTWAQAMIAHVWSGGSRDERLVIDPASGTDETGLLQTTGYNDFGNLRWLGSEASSTPIFAPEHHGQWHCVEAQVRLNRAGQTDGVFRLWIDGKLEAERAGLNWVGAYDEYGINAVFVSNHWNGGSPTAQERYIDNLVVSTERIGCP